MANDLLIRLITKYSGKGVKEAEKDVKKLQGLAKSVGGTLGLAFGATEVLDFTRESISLARVQAQAEAQVASAIESTGNAAQTSLSELKAHAGALQAVTNFGDEATLQGQALLLTFKNIRESLPRATEVMLDVSQAMGQDIKSSAIQLGKALNDPITGLTALSRVGITFSDEQERTIRTLAESGRLFEAQSLILDELESQFGGSARAARDADGGATAFANSVGDLQEAVGQLVIAMTGLDEKTNTSIAFIDTLTNRIGAWPGVFDNAGKAADILFDKFFDAEDIPKLLERTEESLRVFARSFGIPDFLTNQAIQFGKDVVAREEEIADLQAETQEEGGDKRVQVETETVDELLDIKRALARDLMDIEEDTNDELLEAAEDLADAQQDVLEDHEDRLGDISKRGAKRRLKIQKDLTKALAKVDKDLTKALAKLNQDADKRINKLRSDAAKDEENDRKRAKVDALEDERLFQFRLRKLSAEGDGIAIQEAMELRAIQEEIAKERAETEASIEAGRQRDREQEIRTEARERESILRQESAERAEELKARAEEERQLQAEAEAEQNVAAAENLAKRQDDLKEHYDERVDAIEEGEQEAIAQLARSLSEMEEITAAGLDQLVLIAKEIGPEIGETLADEIDEAFAENLSIDKIIAGIGDRSGGGESNQLPLPDLPVIFRDDPEPLPLPDLPVISRQNEGIIPGPMGRAVPIVAHGGEVVLNPSNQGSLGGGTIVVGGQEFVVEAAQRLAAAINDQRQRDMQSLVDQLAEHFA